MSRTKKDRPYWVQVNDKSTKYRTHYHDHTGRWKEFEYCTVDEPEEGPSHWRGRATQTNPCGHYLSVPHVCDPHSVGNRSDRYWAPARQDERTYLKNAVKDHNTFGEVDEDYFLQEKTLHATYGGGWWD